jgi:hypothetical protein
MACRVVGVALPVILALAAPSAVSAQGAYPLAGVWNCSGAYQSQYIFKANGEYQAQAIFGPANGITHWGLWRMVGPTWARLYVKGWEPHSMTMPAEDNFAFQPVGSGQIVTPDGFQCFRAG